VKCPTSIDIMAATVNGNVMVDRFVLDPDDPTRVLRVGNPNAAHGQQIMRSGIRAAGFTGVRLAQLAKACGIELDPSKMDILPSDGLMLALLARYDGHIWAVPTSENPIR